MFSKNGLEQVFDIAKNVDFELSENSKRIISLKQNYLHSIDTVIQFLQGQKSTIAHLICGDDFLPKGSRFDQLDDLQWAFGTLGIQDKAKHLATLYLEDISDLIIEAIDPHFGFSRYAEKLSSSASEFDELHNELNLDNGLIDNFLLQLLDEKISDNNPTLICFSVPFPGNLYSALKSAQFIKKKHPNIKIAMGGGFPNTELRSLSDTRVFEYFDFISLDDGETPILNIIEHLEGKRDIEDLKRTFILKDNHVQYTNGSKDVDIPQKDTGTPDYSDLLLDKYLSVIEIANPMHRMWNDGRWNKLTLAHGCYWAKCTFCDVSLDYIKRYEPLAAKLLCDRIETIIEQTGENGFHFVDEAAPPALMKELALEILRRKLVVVWWTNIRFEKSFSKDLCLLLKESGCIAVSGGLEVASDRLLKLIDKGVTVAQVARVTNNFTQAGILVHSYLMYGYPTQTAQETIDSLEMVRQLFELGIVQSGFWHRFAMTVHSPVGITPDKFNIKKESNTIGSFANNEVYFIDEVEEHSKFSNGLKKSLYNYMHGVCFDMKLQEWFDFKIPKTNISKHYIENVLMKEEFIETKENAKIVWIGNVPEILLSKKKVKKNSVELAVLKFHNKNSSFELEFSKKQGFWIRNILNKISLNNPKTLLFKDIKSDYLENNLEHFVLFWNDDAMSQLRNSGLLVL